MKKVLTVLAIFLLFPLFIFSQKLNCTIGYAPSFLLTKANNEFNKCNLAGNGICAKANYLFNDYFGINLNVFSTIIPTVTINKYEFENNEFKLVSNTKSIKFENNYTSLQIGFSAVGNCAICYFIPQIDFDFSIFTYNKQLAFYSGISFDYSYNQPIKNCLLTVGCNAVVDFISFSNITIDNTKIIKTYKFSPYVCFGLQF